jgi:transcriptional regulator with PAS, ATPase and Fis domain
VLQERHVLGIGEDHEVAVRVRVIAATNRDLGTAVREQRFRPDLFHRLNVLSIHIPPLRERRADVRPLVEYLIDKNRSLQPAAGRLSASPEFIEALARTELSGNVRQLENLVRRALVNKVTSMPLSLTDLPPEVWRQLATEDASPLTSERQRERQSDMRTAEAGERRAHRLPSDLVNLLDSHGWNLAQTLRHCERILLESTLRRKQGNQSQTARALGLTPRSIYSKMRKHRLLNG